jgi:hypothetical protein
MRLLNTKSTRSYKNSMRIACLPRNPCQDLQERRLARAVAADDAHDLAFIHLEVDVLERPEGLRALPQLLERLHRRFQRGYCRFTKGLVRPVQADPVPLREVLHLNDRLVWLPQLENYLDRR